jgi:Fe-S oxidoreductase
MCKSLCPVFLTMREEYLSPRGRTIIMQNSELNEVLFKCNLCKACEHKCPLKIKVWKAVKKSREAMNLKNKQLKGNKEMLKNIKETGNPFGKNPEKTSKLYCC